MGKRSAREIWEYDSMAEFEADGGAARYGTGVVIIEGKHVYIDEHGVLEPIGSVLPNGSLDGDLPPKYVIDFYGAGLPATAAVSGAGLTLNTNARVIDTNSGVRMEWDAGANLSDGNYVSAAYVPETPLNLENTDRIFLEFTHDNNWFGTRLQIVFSSVAGSASGASHRYTYLSSKKTPEVGLMLVKSDFTLFSGTGVNWADVKRIEFRFTKHTASDQNQRAGVDIKRMLIGAKTKPLILYTCDDNAVGIYEDFVRNGKYGFHPDIFVTDYEVPGEKSWSETKCTMAQNKEMAKAGYRFYPHNIDHKPFCLNITAYSRVSNTVTLTVSAPVNAKQPVPVAGDSIVIDEAPAEQLNGTWTIGSVTGTGPYSIVITVTGASFDNQTSNTGATLTLLKNDYQSDMKQLQAMIKRSGLPTDERYLSYTYGNNSRKNHAELAKLGFTMARSTTGTNGQPEYFSAIQVFQIMRKFGFGADSSRLMSIPTLSLDDTNWGNGTITNAVARLLEVGGVLSLYNHQQYPGNADISVENQDAAMAYLAQLRDSGLVKVVNMRELEAHINARRT